MRVRTEKHSTKTPNRRSAGSVADARSLERACRFTAGRALGALPRSVSEKTLTADRVPGQSARKVSWLFTGQVEVKEGAPEALPMMISVNVNTQWVSLKRAACAQRTGPARLRRSAALCGSSCRALQCRRVSSVKWQRWCSSPVVAESSC